MGWTAGVHGFQEMATSVTVFSQQLLVAKKSSKDNLPWLSMEQKANYFPLIQQCLDNFALCSFSLLLLFFFLNLVLAALFLSILTYYTIPSSRGKTLLVSSKKKWHSVSSDLLRCILFASHMALAVQWFNIEAISRLLIHNHPHSRSTSIIYLVMVFT